MKTKSNKLYNRSKTKKRANSNIGILAFLMTMVDSIKLYHWETRSYPEHKATDELYESLNGLVDTFIEVLLGKTNSRFNIPNSLNLKIKHFKSTEELIKEIEDYKSYLVYLDKKLPSNMTNSDLLNIRDEILSQLNKFLYLLTLH